MLEARNVTFAYPHQAPVYQGLSLCFSPYERVALTAPSGFGKTTLCRLLAGYETPSVGQILVDGVPLPKQGKCPVQMIGQHPELSLDPRMRMVRSLQEAGDVSDSLLDDLGIRPSWLSRYPHELSGGEMQRFCIARALAAEPRYLVADEISTMLDAVTQAQLWHFILDVCKRQSIGLVFVSHSSSLVERIATRVLPLDSLAC